MFSIALNVGLALSALVLALLALRADPMEAAPPAEAAPAAHRHHLDGDHPHHRRHRHDHHGGLG